MEFVEEQETKEQIATVAFVESGHEETKAARNDAVVMVSRSTVYFVITAIAFFVIGFGVAWMMLSFSGQNQTGDMQEVVREAVAEAIAALDLSATGAVAGQQPTQPSAFVDVSQDDDPALGPEDAPVVIVEFSDFRCAYCGHFHQQTLLPLLEQYGDQLRLVYRDFPVVGGEAAALAAECADDQGLFWEYHDLLFENQRTADLSNEESLVSLASQMDGLDTETFATCLQEREHEQEVLNDFNDGRSHGVSGTPTFFINGQRLVGAQPIVAFQSVIDEILAEAGG